MIRILPKLMCLAFDFIMLTLVCGKYMVCDNIKTLVNFIIDNMSVLNTDRISYNQHLQLPVISYHTCPNTI